jgi:GDPmannose 4,6-dehydratase
MIALILGDSGQDGIYLRDRLHLMGIKVLNIPRKDPESRYSINISSFESVSSIIKDCQPDLVFHLAARSSVDHTFILDNHEAIVQGSLNVLEAVYRFSIKSRVFIASSGLAFEESIFPLTERSALCCSSSYSLCRVESIYIAKYYRKLGVQVFIGYLFNHESIKRPYDSLARRIAREAVRVSLGLQDNIIIRNPWVVREWMHAQDAVNAMIVLINQNDVWEACIGDGVGRSIYSYAAECCKFVGVDLGRYLISDDSYEPHYNYLVSDPRVIRELGWEPQISFEQLTQSLIKHELVKIKINQ